ncbi:MAG: hypothetical protein HZT43_11085 [Exiguobacterium profundum]|nr:MAG: hypothetical protein HZT43_11085 [Exiguobacterium profundum]
MSGEAGNDFVYGGKDADSLYGGTGGDVLHGNQFHDLVHGDAATTASMAAPARIRFMAGRAMTSWSATAASPGSTVTGSISCTAAMAPTH